MCLKDVTESKWSLEKLNIPQNKNIEKHMTLGIIVSIYQVWGEASIQSHSQTSPVAGFLIDRDIIL